MKDEESKKPTPPPQRNIKIEFDEQMAQGVYTNLTMINHNETEFVFDFIYVQPNQPKAKVRSRVIMNPKHTRRFLAALERNFGMYEKKFGPVKKNPTAPPKDSGEGELVH